ncbi:MAG: iron-containing alcohol dehydrogenase [Desulfurococcales archaeon]|nr:iron-containing alcohol dehydrogenase [Desulfurococcales archaeon]
MVELGFPRRIIYNEPAGEALKGLLGFLGVKRVLIVTDKVVSGLPFFAGITGALEEGGYEFRVFDEVEPEPPIDVGDDVADAARELGAEAIIAVGGGSVIDAAKAGLVKLIRPDVGVEEVAPFNPLGLELRRPVLIAVPTTSGTGSDASYGIVLTKVEEGRRLKIAVGSYEVIPYATILDPAIVKGMNRKLTIGTAVDALAHAVEALASTQSNTLTDALAVKVVEVVFRALPRILEDPENEELRAEMHLAATMAGMAFSNAGLGLAHAIAHPLGATLKVHHGTIVGLVLPYVVDYNYESEEARAKYEYAKKVIEELLGRPRMVRLSDHIRKLYEEIGQPTRIRELGVSREDFESVKKTVAEEALHDPDIAYNPRTPIPDDIEKLLDEMY